MLEILLIDLFLNFFLVFIADFIILTWIGQKPVKDTFILVGQIATVYYLLFFF
jgi:quinol-cytochrome oxidoreductase complex cytochrome b subunit